MWFLIQLRFSIYAVFFLFRKVWLNVVQANFLICLQSTDESLYYDNFTGNVCPKEKQKKC